MLAEVKAEADEMVEELQGGNGERGESPSSAPPTVGSLRES